MRFTTICALVFLLYTLSGCNKVSYRQEVLLLDAKIMALDSASNRLSKVLSDSMNAIGLRIDADMRLVSARYVGEMPIEMAKKLNDYRGIKSLVKKSKPILADVKSEIPLIRRQLVLLREAITSGAKRDAKGTEIDAEYLKGALRLEIMNANAAIAAVNEGEKRVTKTIENFGLFYPPVKSLLDSLDKNHLP